MDLTFIENTDYIMDAWDRSVKANPNALALTDERHPRGISRLKVDELKPEFERPFNNGRPLHGSMFRRIVKPEEVETSEYDFENEIAVFYEDGSFAGMIVLIIAAVLLIWLGTRLMKNVE